MYCMMLRIELIIGSCLIAIGIVPVGLVVASGSVPQAPPPTCFGPAGYMIAKAAALAQEWRFNSGTFGS